MISGKSDRLLPKASRPPLGGPSKLLLNGYLAFFPRLQLTTHLDILLRCGAVPPRPHIPARRTKEKFYINFTYFALLSVVPDMKLNEIFLHITLRIKTYCH